MISRDDIFSPSFNNRLNRVIRDRNANFPQSTQNQNRIDLILDRTLVRLDRLGLEEKREGER